MSKELTHLGHIIISKLFTIHATAALLKWPCTCKPAEKKLHNYVIIYIFYVIRYKAREAATPRPKLLANNGLSLLQQWYQFYTKVLSFSFVFFIFVAILKKFPSLLAVSATVLSFRIKLWLKLPFIFSYFLLHIYINIYIYIYIYIYE